MDLLWGWLITLGVIAAVAAVLKWGVKIDQTESEEDSAWHPIPDEPEAGETQIIRIEPLILDTRVVAIAEPEPETFMGEVVDELGAWRPWEHEPAQPLIMADVLLSGAWGGLRANELGMVAS